MGWRAIRDDIELTRGDFIMSRTNTGGALPPGTSAEIVWANGQTWPATVDGATVAWRVESTVVALVPAGTAFVLWIHYPNQITSTTDDYEWIKGVARR
ncbi:hypothetical protein [Nocardia brasiliensis]|uniref:LtfC-like domain-containing protein n=1 Tax=Nocardia brasiliensis TaxID=37326 RepID=UPI003670C3C0